MVIIGGYSGIASTTIENLKSSHPEIEGRQFLNEL